jgi:hypothetical protein
MANLPVPLYGQKFLGTPQNSPVIALPGESNGPSQLRALSIEPEYSQFQRARKLQFTGRGQTIVFASVFPDAVNGNWTMFVSDPIPFRAVLRSLIYFALWNTLGGAFHPFVCRNFISGNYQQDAFPTVEFPLTGIRPGGDVSPTLNHLIVSSQSFCPMNYLLAGPGMRVGIAQNYFTDLDGTFTYIFELLEVASEE